MFKRQLAVLEMSLVRCADHHELHLRILEDVLEGGDELDALSDGGSSFS